MAETKIEWSDMVWNPVTGCTKVSPGCDHCYAETFAERWRGVPGHPYEQGFDLKLWPERLDMPLRWRKPRRVFVNSMSDLFHQGVPDEYIAKVFAVMAEAPWHTFQVLTKRPGRMASLLSRPEFPKLMNRAACEFPDLGYPLREDGWHGEWPLRNVWLGTSVESQKWADVRVPLLLKTPAAVRFLSCEPLLGPVDLGLSHPGFPYIGSMGGDWLEQNRLDWVIVGGESGPGARPMDLEWVRSLVGQCRAAGVAAFVKQLGAHPYQGDLPWLCRSSKGGAPDEWPADLRVREFPQVAR
jgi:protein gp37